MKVLLLAPNYNGRANSDFFPLGLAYLASYIEKLGHEIISVNLNNYNCQQGYEILHTLVDQEQIDLVGLGGLTASYTEIGSIIRLIREWSPKLPIVLGGGITSSETELIMQALRPDYAVIGEGELIFADILNTLEKRLPIQSVRGIWHWDKNIPVFTGVGPEIKDLDPLPFPAVDKFGMFEFLERQLEDQYDYHLIHFDCGKTIPIIASRSCPFDCTFCSHAGLGRYRIRSIKNVIDEIEALTAAYKVYSFAIYDELFAARRERVLEFCALLHERNLEITWSCQLRVDQLDQELLYTMKKAGCNFLSYGFESGSDTILKSMNKKIISTQIKNCVAMTRKAQIGFQANFLYGDPSESIETLDESIKFQEDNELYFTDWSTVIPYPGSKLYEFCLKQNLIQDKIEFIESLCNLSTYLWQKKINMTTMPDEIFELKYLNLRELNDSMHRRQEVIVNESETLDQYNSKMTIECPSCGFKKTTTITYPPECRTGGEANLKSVIGVRGMNILCSQCARKMHLKAKEIPHINRHYNQFQERIDLLVKEKRQIVILPALDRFKTVFFEDINLSHLKVSAVLDSRPHRINTNFLNSTVKQLSAENIIPHIDKTFVILPWVEFNQARELLESEGVKDILCWNLIFV